jgi:hypothetical protein
MPGSLEIDLDQPAPLANLTSTIHTVDNAFNYVHGQLQIPVPQKPSVLIVELPRDVTALNDDQLGNLMASYSQWISYIDYQLAIADGQREAAETYLTYIQARVRIEIKSRQGSEKRTVQDKNDIMETNDKVVAAKEKYVFWESTYRLTKSLRDSAQLAWDTISRRITQRGQEVDRTRRESNVAGVPAAARTFRHT